MKKHKQTCILLNPLEFFTGQYIIGGGGGKIPQISFLNHEVHIFKSPRTEKVNQIQTPYWVFAIADYNYKMDFHFFSVLTYFSKQLSYNYISVQKSSFEPSETTEHKVAYLATREETGNKHLRGHHFQRSTANLHTFSPVSIHDPITNIQAQKI